MAVRILTAMGPNQHMPSQCINSHQSKAGSDEIEGGSSILGIGVGWTRREVRDEWVRVSSGAGERLTL